MKLGYLFSKYTDSRERAVGRFLKGINENTHSYQIEKPLLTLLQKNAAIVNLFSEREYKGYRYLTKRKRRELYGNLQLIEKSFVEFAKNYQVNTQNILNEIASLGADISQLRLASEKLEYLVAIMAYLSPQNGRFVYREASSFGRLLRDPGREQLIGDCNQIVTLYIVLYALRYDISELRLTVLPGHVAIHFRGVDIESTSGSFKYYLENSRQVPVQEIVSINLLDTTDEHFKISKIRPQTLLEAARLAYIISSERELVVSNLKAAYHNAVTDSLRQKRFKEALRLARQSKDRQLIEASAQSGAIASLQSNDFKNARRFASSLKNPKEMLKSIDQAEAATLYNAKNYHAALKIYQRISDQKMVKNCYRGMFYTEQAKLGNIKNQDDLKAHTKTIRNMERFAKASGDSDLIDHVQGLIKYV